MNETTKADLIDVPHMFVMVNGDLHQYSRLKTTGGFTIYQKPFPVNVSMITMAEFLFLPVTKDKFVDDDILKVGYLFIFINEIKTTVASIDNPSMSYNVTEIGFSIQRIFYEVRGKSTINITKIKDRLFPAQLSTMEGTGADMVTGVYGYTNKILDHYCEHYMMNDV